MTDTSVIIKALEHIYADTIEVTNGEPVTKQLSEALSPLIAVFPTEDELLKLRIENAYLKELRRLRLEEETLLKKQRESSTASEETSD